MPDRFPAEVAQALSDAGWAEGRRVEQQATDAVSIVGNQVGHNGARLESFDAAETALTEFCGLLVLQDGPGVDLRRRPFVFEPSEVAASAESLADLRRQLDARLFGHARRKLW